MTRKVYKTAQGKMVDLGALQLRNENVRAVGNMAVNAKGDLIDSNNRPIESRNQQVAKNYKRQISNVTDENIDRKPTKPTAEEKNPKEPKITKTEDNHAEPAESSNKPVSGLAAAIAKARQIKQEELKSPRQVAAFHQRKTEN